MSKHAMTRVKTKSNDLKTQTVENYTTVCRTGANAGYSYRYNIHHIHSANYFSEPQLQLQPRHQLQLQLPHQGQVPATTPIAPTNRSNPRATAITRPTATACYSYFYATDYAYILLIRAIHHAKLIGTTQTTATVTGAATGTTPMAATATAPKAATSIITIEKQPPTDTDSYNHNYQYS